MLDRKAGHFLRCLFFDMFDNIADFAIEHIAERVERFCADVLSVFHAVKGVGGKALVKNQMIFRDILFEKRIIKRLITDHIFRHRTKIIILNLLTILKILSIMEENHTGGGWKR